MDLFSEINKADNPDNLLPYNGEVYYFGPIFSAEESIDLYQKLLDGLAWKADEAVIFGKHITTKRKVAWYADQAFEYTYSNTTKKALEWTDSLLFIRERTQKIIGETFNSCLANLYHSGEEGMAWHSDGEKDLVKHGCIASLSFGATRWFHFKHKQSAEKRKVELVPGSLLIMQGSTQTHWLHRLPPTKKVHSPRINLTFRQMREGE